MPRTDQKVGKARALHPNSEMPIGPRWFLAMFGPSMFGPSMFGPLVVGAVATGCVGLPSDDSDTAEEGDEHVAQVSAPLISNVDCNESSATAYVNGNAKAIKVITIDGKRVTRATGHAFLRMQRAANNAGVGLSLTSGFRSYAEQSYLYDCYLSGKCNGGNLAARPGYSNHQSGTAVDVSTSSWLAANAKSFGFVRTVPSEPWHYELTGPDPGGPCSTGDDRMSWVSPQDGGWYANGIWFKATAPGAAKVVYSAGPCLLGESKDASQDFAVRYTFSMLGTRSVTARAYSASGALVAENTITIRVTS